MTFTPAEHAKPKVPHKEGLACVECGARETSQWRGIGGRYCSAAGCRKLADEERKQAIAGKSLEQLAALEERLEEAERTIEHQAAAIEELTDDVKALRAGLGRLAQQQMVPRTPQSTGCGSKRRSVLADASNLSRCARSRRPARPHPAGRRARSPRRATRPPAVRVERRR